VRGGGGEGGGKCYSRVELKDISETTGRRKDKESSEQRVQCHQCSSQKEKVDC